MERPETVLERGKEIIFTIHNEIHKVKAGTVTSTTSLNSYLRDVAKLKGTKNMCFEGGCGACIVAVKIRDPITNREKCLAVNSCLVPILACHNWSIHTVEGIGNRRIGYHPVQKALAKFNGTQCGYCSGGMVMNMYALLEENQYLSMSDIENSFGGNLCRCTGYRPIMDAFKSLSADADKRLLDRYPDIEDIVCPKSGRLCGGNCNSAWDFIHGAEDKVIHLEVGESSWYKIINIENILELFQSIGDEDYRFAAGNTAKGVYRIKKPPKIYIDISSVPELMSHKLTKNYFQLGANISLTDIMNIFLKVSEENPDYWYLKKVYHHIDVVANVPVRNIGTIAGNLSIKHEHNEFPSDIFLLLESIGAQLTIVKRDGSVVTKSPVDYLQFDMKKCFIKTITLYPLPQEDYIFESYKITPRTQNAHAYVNAAFLIKVDKENNVKSARILYGGINSSFAHAIKTEQYLINKHLFDQSTLQNVFQILNDEIKPDNVLTDASVEYRKNLASSLFYKFILKNAPKDKVNAFYASGGSRIQRAVSSGIQDFETDKKLYPLGEPINKTEGLIQCSGEIEYINDIPSFHNEVFGAFILADTVPFSTIKKIITSEALSQKGVVAFITHQDIPGANSFSPPLLSPTTEEIFCSGKVMFNGQPIGLILADTFEQALAAAAQVQVIYEKSQKQPRFTTQEVLKAGETDRIQNKVDVKAKRKGNDTKHKIKGTFVMGGQYHLTMETQTAVCVPTDDGGYDVYSATQWMDHCQMSISLALKLPQNKINLYVKRLGGAYGAKIVRATQIAAACAVASHKLNRPVRIKLPLSTNMKMIGKRVPIYAEYELGVDDNGVIQYMENTFYHDHSTSGENEPAYFNTVGNLKSCYDYDTWHINGNVVQTDMPGNCYCRAPGSVEGIGIIEQIMDQIAMVTNKDSLQVRIANLPAGNKYMLELIDDLKEWSDYEARKAAVEEFNKKNRWMKKGISFVIMNYPFEIFGTFHVFISIYAGDGTVAISHGGIECGQGINTKVIQVCAYMFHIPIETISIKSTNTLNSPNNMMTGGSITSEAVCYATMRACKTILERLEPVKKKLNNPTWQELVKTAHDSDVDLTATHMYSKSSENIAPYDINGACVTEVEVDVLTGEHNVVRVDLIEDVGSSMSPEIDVGQIEGAFVMGMGYYTCEKLVYAEDGSLLTNNTWTYKVPGVKEIPDNFRVKMKRNSGNPQGVFNSKAVGEPPLCLSVSVPLAIRNALASARVDSEKVKEIVPFDGPTTVEFTYLYCLNNFKQYSL